MKSDLAVVRDHFMKRVKQAGITLSPDELLRFAKERGLDVSRREVEKLKLWSKATSVFHKFVKPEAFISASILKPGCVFVDFANYYKFRNKDGKLVNWSKYNGGAKGFIAGADTLSGKLAAVPVKDKSGEEWARAVRKMLTEDFPEARAVVSDRDSAVTTEEFRTAMEEEFNITWIYMKTMSKSAAAERAIRTIKTHMSMGLRAKTESFKGKTADKFNWTRMLPRFLEHFNSQPTKGTDIARKDVGKMNYLKVLDQKMAVEDSAALQNTRVMDPEVLGSKRNIKAVFKFDVGDRVVLELGADFERTRSETDTRRVRSNYFEKRSVHGTYGSKTHEITERTLKSTSPPGLVPVYRLSGFGNVWFYERQLARVFFN